jgi:radical SAM superfamily enzyme YgiQ (UPF0313 family)
LSKCAFHVILNEIPVVWNVKYFPGGRDALLSSRKVRMSFLRYDEPVYRPPSEAESLILQATIGCSHNGCAFCYMYKEKSFRVKPWDELKAEIDDAAGRWPGTRRIFLADGDAFVLGTDRLERLLDSLAASFPRLQRVTAYATPQNLLAKSALEMKRLRDKGLSILYYGVESGDGELLRTIGKGATPDEMADGCGRAREAGIKLSVTVILGLGGREGSLRHARATALLLNRIQPKYLSTLTLMLGPYGEEYRRRMGPGFVFNSPLDDVRELREIVSLLETDRCIFRSNHASNYLPLEGTLMRDRERLLAEIERAIEAPEALLRPEWMRGL